MDIRVQGEAINAAATQPSRAQEAARLSGKEGTQSLTGSSNGGDSVNLSDLATKISAANEDAEVRANQKVETLAALYSRGAAISDPASVSRALVSHAIGLDGDWA